MWFHGFMHELYTGFLSDLQAYLLHIGLLGTTAGITYIMIKFGPSVACMWLCCRSNHIVYTCENKRPDL